MQEQNPPIKAYLALGLGLTIIGFSAIFVRLADAPGIVSGFYRMLIGALLLTHSLCQKCSQERTLSA